MIRYFRQVSSNRWLSAVIITSEKSGVPLSDHQAQIAEGLGVPQVDIEVVDADIDPRSGLLVELPSNPGPPDPRIAALAAKVAALVASLPGAALLTATQRASLENSFKACFGILGQHSG